MNIALNLSKGQLSKLRNGHGIRINPTMFGSDVDLIVDPMTYHIMAKKLDTDKDIITKLGMSEIDTNKIEGAGNKSGIISRIKKARKWRDFAGETVKDGIDLGRYGYKQYKEATNPIASEGKKHLKEFLKCLVAVRKIWKVAKYLNLISDGYDRATDEVGKYKNLKPLAEHMGKTRQGSVRKAIQMSGLGASGKGKIVFGPAVMRPAVMPRGKGLRLSHGDGMRLSCDGMRMSIGMCCQGCGMMNDHFIFGDVAL